MSPRQQHLCYVPTGIDRQGKLSHTHNLTSAIITSHVPDNEPMNISRRCERS